MMFMRLLTPAFGAALAVVGAGCVSSPGASAGDVYGESVSLTQCPLRTAEPTLRVFDEAGWVEHLNAIGEQDIAPGQWLVNFETQSIVLVTLGEKPTLGYGISANPPSQRSAGSVALQVKQQAPAPGMMSAMALSTPCTYVLLNTAGFDELVVTDADSSEILHTWKR